MSKASGFSLVELLVALVIFSFGVLAALALLGAGHRWEGQAEIETELTVLAEMKLEEFKAIAGTDLPDTVQLRPGGSLNSNVSGYWDAEPLDNRYIARRWRVRWGPGGTREVTVRAFPLKEPEAGRADLTTYVIHE